MDSYFGNPENDPILKGKGATSDKNKTKIYKVLKNLVVENLSL